MRFCFPRCNLEKNFLRSKTRQRRKSSVEMLVFPRIKKRRKFRSLFSTPKRRIVRHLLSLKKPDKVDILAARKLQLSGGVDAALSCILFFVSGSLQFQLPTKNEIGSPFRGSLSHFLVGAVLQQLLLLAEMVGFSRGLSNSNGLRLLIFPQPLGRALKNQNAAPTTPPCFCHRQRSSSLHRADCLRSADRRPVLILTIFAAKKAPA